MYVVVKRCLGLLMLPMALAVIAAPLDSIRITPYDYACVRVTDTRDEVVSSHQRPDKAQTACQNAKLADPDGVYETVSGRWRVVIDRQALAGLLGNSSAPDTGPPNNPPTWFGTPSPEFDEGIASNYGLAGFFSDPEGDPLTLADGGDCTLPTGVTVSNPNKRYEVTTGTTAGTTTGCSLTVSDGVNPAVKSSTFSIVINAAEELTITDWCDTSAQGSGDGSSAANAAVPSHCFNNLSAGDVAEWGAGNYGGTDFEPNDSGTSGNWIRHVCETEHGCNFDRIIYTGVSFVEAIDIKSDSEFWTAGHSFTNERAPITNSNNLKFTNVLLRGEPQICADGNPGTAPTTNFNCSTDAGGVNYNRYNDCWQVDTGSHTIEWDRGQTLGCDHAPFQFFGDSDLNLCESSERNFWVHGTPSDPYIIENPNHHNFSWKNGSCQILVEHIQSRQAGTGRGSLDQPDNSTSSSVGGTFHGSSYQHATVRFSVLSKGGAGTSSLRHTSIVEIGGFAGGADSKQKHACFAHNSYYRPWGHPINLRRVSSGGSAVAAVEDVYILNSAIEEAHYLETTNPGESNSPFEGYAIVRGGSATDFEAYVDGLVFNTTKDQDLLMYDNVGGTGTNHLTSGDVPTTVDSVEFGSTVTFTTAALFNDPVNWDMSPVHASIINTAVPVTNAIGSGSSSTSLTVTRPGCFQGTMNGMRAGDVIYVGGTKVTATAVNTGTGVLTITPPADWSNNDPIYFDLEGALMNDIGAIQ